MILKKITSFFIFCLQKAGTPTFIVYVRDTIVANLMETATSSLKKLVTSSLQSK